MAISSSERSGMSLTRFVDTGIRAAKGPGGEAAVAAALVLRRALEHGDAGAIFTRCQRRAQGGIAAADDQDLEHGSSQQTTCWEDFDVQEYSSEKHT